MWRVVLRRGVTNIGRGKEVRYLYGSLFVRIPKNEAEVCGDEDEADEGPNAQRGLVLAENDSAGEGERDVQLKEKGVKQGDNGGFESDLTR
jgi:hypothetical protein